MSSTTLQRGGRAPTAAEAKTSADEPSAEGKPAEPNVPDGGTGALTGDSYDAEDVFEGAEPWDPIETKIVVGSFIAAAVTLVIFGILIHIYILD